MQTAIANDREMATPEKQFSKEVLMGGDGRVTALVESIRQCDFESIGLEKALLRYQAGAFGFDQTYEDKAPQSLSFNVMPGRRVEEHLTPKKYNVGYRIARVEFDRVYETEMEKSPTHLIFMSALIQWQKLVYLMMCREFDIFYDPNGPEHFKIWPTDIRCTLPVLIRREKGLMQDTVISYLQEVSKNKWSVEGFSCVDSRVALLSRASVYRIS